MHVTHTYTEMKEQGTMQTKYNWLTVLISSVPFYVGNWVEDYVHASLNLNQVTCVN